MRRGMIGVVGVAALLAGCATMESGGASASADGRDRSNPITRAPHIGRCHMGGCSWFDIRSFEMVRETPEAALIRLDMRDGSSMHGQRPAPRSSRGVRIEWSAFNRDTYIFCSRRMPAIISGAEDGNGYEAYRLDLLSPAGATEYVTQQYQVVCHPDEDMNREGAAQRLGYRRNSDQDWTPLRLRSPEEMFERLASR